MKANRNALRQLPVADSMKNITTYENFIALCPCCKKQNIFNRVSDLKTFKPISRKEVRCIYCSKAFVIGTDSISEKYEYFLLDCYDLKAQKKYMSCIINLCQACEAFFLKCTEIKLLWLPWRTHVFGKLEKMYEYKCRTKNKTKMCTCYDIFNLYSSKLHNKLKDCAYQRLLSLFYDLYLNDKSFRSQKEIDNYINNMECYAKMPKDEDIEKKCDGKLRKLLVRLKKSDINIMRNKVAHKDGFRPTLEDVEYYLEDIREIIFGLKRELKLEHEIMYTTISNTIDSLGDR